MTSPTSLPELVAALDPRAPYVLLPDFTPIQGPWQEAAIPLTPNRGLSPTRGTVRRVTIDVLLPTADFIELADDLRHRGLWLMQFRKRPRWDVNYEDHAGTPGWRSTRPSASPSASTFPMPTK